MNDARIILVEDEEVTGELLKKILQSGGFSVSLFQDGTEAVKAYRENPCSVFITDLEMPAMSGDRVIEEIRAINEDQVIIVVTSYSDSATIINIMKKEVYDYIVKPVEPGDLIATVKRASETAELRRMKKILEKEKVLKLQNQLDWFKWNENIITRNYDRVDRSLFTNLHESFNQGAGFGSLLTLISLISANAKHVDGSYVIDEQIFNLVKENARVAEKILGVFSELIFVMNRDFTFETITAADLHAFLGTIIGEVSPFASVRKMRILLNDPKPVYGSVRVSIDTENLRKALYEIMINAVKFSKPGTTAIVLLDVEVNSLSVSVINSPEIYKNDVVGIPFEYENLIFEPFYRMAKIVFEEFETPDYGLGLTLVEKIIKKHDAKITISNIIDSSDISRAPEIKVSAVVSLSLVK